MTDANRDKVTEATIRALRELVEIFSKAARLTEPEDAAAYSAIAKLETIYERAKSFGDTTVT